jgi:hypothetical protein
MNADDFGVPLDARLRKEARALLREALNMDRNNLATWELLLRATYNAKEELHCLKRILAIDPKHVSAARRLAALQSTSIGSAKQSSRGKRRESTLLLLFLGSLVSIVCLGAAGFVLLRGGYLPFTLPNLTATALAQRNASCQVLIDRAIQASGNYCDDTGSNSACYGNTTIEADLAPDSTQRFSERGDTVSVSELSRLTASPLDLESSEWGIAVFKLIANLPRSLPGETVTMVVFGNATLDNKSGDSGNLESFYFSSELGQIACDKVPFDGLMITAPDGGGIRFSINNAELTLMGTASVKALRNGEMEVNVYKGSARIVSNGQEQYVGAGHKSSVQLGGDDGTNAVSAPSEPEPLAQDELDIACTMTGQYCSQDEIVPVSPEEAQAQIQNQVTATPSLTLSPTLTPIPSATLMPTNTLLVLPTGTSSPGPTFTRTPTRTPGPTRTQGPTQTFTLTSIFTPTRTNTPTATRTPTRTNTPTFTPTRTNTPTATSTPTSTFTSTSTFTPTSTPTSTPSPTFTFTPTPTSIAPSEPLCPTVSLGAITNPNTNELGVDITNNSGGDISAERFFAYWVKLPASQKIDRLLLNGILIWNTSDNDSPSDIPIEGNWIGGADRIIPNGAVENLLIRFQDDLQATGYEIHIVFDIGCQVIGNK